MLHGLLVPHSMYESTIILYPPEQKNFDRREHNSNILQFPARHDPIRPCFRQGIFFNLPSMSSEQSAIYRRPSRISCCFATTLSFLVVIPTLCVILTLRRHSPGQLSYSRNLVLKETNRTVRLLTFSLICTAHGIGRHFSALI